ncbi:acyltransferase family protein [Haliscomenobacter hydrossis]|uniref:Acyltransferase 3 n=1 Tax=Haliscomenobacter hydrossis (strain ATCC 27775 / DSM 1100 / LMG 10767 / O) TaxID=760192 RepID=F4L452_HALH1|nr:acyltransferase [Haliscomenobacter hydrossis]AEE50750.1 acyltransferase 3 [Haliscomenobacter hydrossis DSM 1100]
MTISVLKNKVLSEFKLLYLLFKNSKTLLPNIKFGPGGFRLLLSLTVVCYHITSFVFIGHFAVYSFFILSGFWVSKMFQEKYLPQQNPVRTYLISRFLRIYPLYLFLLLLALPVLYYEDAGFFQQESIWDYSLFWLTNLGLLGQHLFGQSILVPAWSLDLEVQFYVLLPLLFYVLKQKKHFVYLFIVSSVAALLIYWFEVPFLNRTVLYFLPFFLLGILMYLFDWKFSQSVVRLSWLITLGIVLLHYVFPANTVQDKNSLYNEWLNCVLAVSIIPFIAHNVKQKSDAIDQTLGSLSYTVYLFHWVLIWPYGDYVEDMSTLQKMVYAPIYLILVVLGSSLIYFYVEPFFSKWRAYFLGMP